MCVRIKINSTLYLEYDIFRSTENYNCCYTFTKNCLLKDYKNLTPSFLQVCSKGKVT